MNRADNSPNAFEAGKPGTAGRDRAQASIEALRAKGGIFVEAVRATRMPMALTDPTLPGNPIVFANDAFLRLSGYRMEEVLGQQPHFMNGRMTDPKDAARFAESLRSDQDDIVETVQYRKDGTRFSATVLVSGFKDEQGNTINHFMSWLDVTRRVNAEAEIADLQASQFALSEELRNTNILRDLSSRLFSENNVQTIYEGILSAAIEITNARAGTLQVLDTETQKLVVIATRGFSKETEDYFDHVDARSDTSCGLALRTGDRSYFNFDPASKDKSARLHVKDGVLSAQSTPLLSRSGRSIGMVTTHWGELDHRASERELRYLDLLARQAADLLEQRAAAQALREKEQRAQTLLAELQHRVRNTLAVMRSIVRRTALGSKTVEEFEQHLGGRLSSFARTQAYVVRDPEGGVDLELIVRDELLAHATGDAQHISIEGPKVRLDARQAEIFGLAVHELTSNAIRHGALASDGNKVDVKWSVKGNDDMRTVRFSWQEKLDRNNLEKPERTGFGIELLDRVLSYELDARPLIEFRPDGYCYQVEFPLATNRKGSAPTH